MLYQILEYGLFRETILLLNFFASITFVYLGFQLGKKIKEAKLLSPTMGLAFHLATLGFSHFFYFFYDIYPELALIAIIKDIFMFLYFLSMVLFVILTEFNQSQYLEQKKKKFQYLLSIISILGFSITYPLVKIMEIDNLPVFLVIIGPFLISCLQFMFKFSSLEIIKHSKIIPLFTIGWAISGFANILKSDMLTGLLGIWIYLLMPIFFILGGFLMAWSWNRFPNLSELDWMLKMERLLIIHRDSSGTLFQYTFQSLNNKESENQTEDVLTGSAMGGIDMLLKEILASEGHINEIDHGNKKVIFSHGIATECILFAQGTSEEFIHRLKIFHLSFEKLFGNKELLNWNGEVTQFNKAHDLILQYFSQ